MNAMKFFQKLAGKNKTFSTYSHLIVLLHFDPVIDVVNEGHGAQLGRGTARLRNVFVLRLHVRL